MRFEAKTELDKKDFLAFYRLNQKAHARFAYILGRSFSVAAVESVLQWGLNNGYSFKALQLDSPAAHHGVNN